MQPVRRRLLMCLPVALAPLPARAFRLEEASETVAAEYQAAACPGLDLHAIVPGEADSPEDAAARAARLLERARCPFCGCAVAGAPDHGEQGPPQPG